MNYNLDKEYTNAVSFTKQFNHSSGILDGFNETTFASKSDNTIVAQNNIIITLLLSLHRKLDLLDQSSKKLSTDVEDELVKKFTSQLNLGSKDFSKRPSDSNKFIRYSDLPAKKKEQKSES